MASTCWFHNAFRRGMDTLTDFSKVASMKAALFQKAYVPNPDHETINDVKAIGSECDATNYARKTISNWVFTCADASNRFQVTSSDSFTWATLGNGTNNSLDTLILFYDTDTTDTNAYVMCCLYLGSRVSTNGGNLKVSFSSTGVIGYVTCDAA